MMEPDLPVCVLICLDVFLGLEKQKSVTNKQKIADAVPKNDKNPTFVVLILYWDTPNSTFLLVQDQLLALETKISI